MIKTVLRRAVYEAMRVSGVTALQRFIRNRTGQSWATGLVFHRLSSHIPEDGLTITPERFDSILGMLKRDYDVLPIAEMATRVREGGPFSGREVVVTFDDGYLDNYELAVPLLEKHGLPACFFITAGYVGTTQTFPWDAERGITSVLMSWRNARDIASRGFDVGCHTWSHPDLGTEPLTSVRRELYDARDRIEDAIGTDVRHFAYPFGGRHNIRREWIDAIRDAGFETNWSADNGVIGRTTQPFYIPRLGAAPQRSLSELRIDMDRPW